MKFTKKNIINSLFIIVYVELLPYASRLWKGFDWVLQYIPNNSSFIMNFFGVFFFSCFAIVPAIPLIILLLKNRLPITFALSIITTSILLIYAHHDYDLSSDAQAAIGLIFIPIYIGLITSFIAIIIGFTEHFLKKKKAT